MPNPSTVANGDIGEACTGSNTDGGAARQGSCGTGELCFEIWSSAGPQCLALCDGSSPDGGACPGSSTCVAFNSGTEDLCVPNCTVHGTDCTTGTACNPLTPGQFDDGICLGSCFSSADCNSGSTTFACTDGVCLCTHDADCGTGERCDLASGSCYVACTGASDTSCASGCCASQGSLNYCDSAALPFATGSGAICATCAQGTDCASGFCNTGFGTGFCDSLAYCNANDGTFSSCGAAVCNPANGSCACAANPIVDAGPAPGAICASCTQDTDCGSGFCDTVFATTGGAGFCDTTNACSTSGAAGTDCGTGVACNSSNGDCACPANPLPPVVDAGPAQAICGTCAVDTDCASNNCNSNNGGTPFCDVPAGCTPGDGQCAPGGVDCNAGNGACACAENVTGPSAICTGCTANADCASGYCDTIFGAGFCDTFYVCNDSGQDGTTCGAVGCNVNGFCGCSENPVDAGAALSCAPGVNLPLDNGDLSATCTGAATDGGVIAGSCTGSGEFCYDLFTDGIDRCYAFCDATTFACPGTSVCLNVGNNTDLCFADCQPNGAACPSSLLCTALTPNSSETGYCYVNSCQVEADCNSSSATQFTCQGGVCACSSDADCASLGTAVNHCDRSSGTCYQSCTGPTDTSTCADGCCANEGTINYCDSFAD